VDEVYEGSTSVVKLTFTDENGDAVIPTSATYRIDDKVTRTSIHATAAFVPVASTYNVEITAAENRILKSTNVSEDRVLTVTFSYGVGKTGTSMKEYRIVNLQFHG
jgi:hypothetical protein